MFLKKSFLFVFGIFSFLFLTQLAQAKVTLEPREHGLIPAILINDNMRISPYGYVYFGGYYETETTGEDTSLNVQPANAGADAPGDFFFNFNASRLGFNFWVESLKKRIQHNAKFEIDFDTGNMRPRIRHAYATVETPIVNLLGGQTWAVVGQNNPMIGFELMSNNNDNAWNLGNAYDRNVQFRLWKDVDDGLGTFQVQFGILQYFNQGRNIIGPTGLTVADQDIPQFQMRFSQTFTLFGDEGYIAGSGSFGRVDASNGNTFTSALGVFELDLPLKYLTLEGEFFYSHGGGFNTGVSQEAVETAAGTVSALESFGGWIGLKVPITPSSGFLTFNAFYGIDNPENNVGGTVVTISKNQMVSGNFYILITDWLAVIPEVEYLMTSYGAGFTEKNFRASLGGYFYF